MFISGGENVYPAEIEKYLYMNPKIKEVAVIGVSDSKWGEVGKAFVVLMPDEESTEEDIIKYCKGNLAKYKIPKYVQILEEIPKTDAGKINKLKLAEIHKTQTTNS
jgi:fatty-acyl-CoA synthase